MAEKESKRELILQSAQRIFMEKGYHAATSEEIAKDAGIGKGTIYQYFSSKKELFDEVRIACMYMYCDNIINAIDLEESFAENIQRLIHVHVSKMDVLIYLLTSELQVFPQHILQLENVPEIHQTMLEKFMELIIHAKENHEVQEVSPQSAMNYIMSVFMGMAHQSMMNKRNAQIVDDVSVERWEEEIGNLLLYGLSAK